MTDSFFDALMTREREALAAEQKLFGVPPFSAVCDIDKIVRSPMLHRAKHPVNLEALGEGSFIQCCPTLGYRSLWTHVENDGYRASYALFLSRQFPGDRIELPANIHVDHVFNRERAREFGLSYVRMALVPGGANSSHGAAYEKKRTRGIGSHGVERSIDTVNWMKLFGFNSPNVARRAGDIRTFALILAEKLGADPAEIEREVGDLLDVANFRPS